MTISGLSVDMDITTTSDDYLVRLIMEDEYGMTYLVAEFSPIITASKKHQIVGYCEETISLWNVRPKEMRIYIYGAIVNIYSLNFSTTTRFSDKAEWKKNYDQLREAQIKFKSDIINNRNKERHELWYAGATSLSKMPFAERMRIIGGSESAVTDGFEYYIGGIFHVIDHYYNDSIDNMQFVSTPRIKCVEEFSWRNRHGKDWLSPVKDQGQSGYCSAFTAISCLEAVANLYFNKKIDMDLSEQEAAVCCGALSPWHGMSVTLPLAYIKNHGVCEDSAYPFVNSENESNYCRSAEITPLENVKISSYQNVSKDEEEIKKALIKYGPLVSGFTRFNHNYPNDPSFTNHAMALYGFDVIKAGDTIFQIMELSYPGDHGLTNSFVVEDSSEFIGRTVWKFKNSYLNGDASNPQYMFITFDNISNIASTYSIRTPVTSNFYSIDDIVCEDSDGDGFYFWGIGDKPSNAPFWVPDEPDGNDADPHVGPMDEFGHTTNDNPENNSITYISTNTNTSSSVSYSNNVVVQNNATWTISHELHFHYSSWIRVKSGATLKIDGGSLISANVILEAGSNLIIENNGLLVSPSTAKFHAGVGVNVNVVCGQIY
jgi:C1A family cysteine protease